MTLLNSIKEYKVAYITIVVILAIGLYSTLRKNNVEANGVITICKIKRYEALSDGSNTYCNLFINGKEYEVISGMGSKSMVGKFYFVKAIKENPSYDIIIYDDKEVPACIFESPLPNDGWKEIPICK